MADAIKNMKDALKGVPKDQKPEAEQAEHNGESHDGPEAPPVEQQSRHVLRRQSLLESLTPAQIRDEKWERIFYTFFDINRNNVIDWEDFEMLFDKIKDIRGENSTEFRIVKDAMGMVWKGLLMDTKGIGFNDDLTGEENVTMEEWKKIWHRYNPQRLTIWQWEYVKNMFFLIDSNGDKTIDLQEYTGVMEMYGMEPEMAKEAFEKFARDENDKPSNNVNYGYFVKLWNQYISSDDKDAPGNYLFGPW